MAQDKRTFSRVPFKVRVDLEIATEQLTLDSIDNLSVGGCLLPLQTHYPAGTPCRLTINLSGTSSDLQLKVSGSVIRSDAQGLALKFSSIDPDSLYHLKNIVRYNVSDPERVEQELRDHPGLF